MIKEEVYLLEEAQKQKIITTSEMNLRSKIDSITRSLENLLAKEARIQFEIKRQRKSLMRKREELKKVTKRVSPKKSLNEFSIDFGDWTQENNFQLSRIDKILLQESNSVIEKTL